MEKIIPTTTIEEIRNILRELQEEEISLILYNIDSMSGKKVLVDINNVGYKTFLKIFHSDYDDNQLKSVFGCFPQYSNIIGMVKNVKKKEAESQGVSPFLNRNQVWEDFQTLNKSIELAYGTKDEHLEKLMDELHTNIMANILN